MFGQVVERAEDFPLGQGVSGEAAQWVLQEPQNWHGGLPSAHSQNPSQQHVTGMSEALDRIGAQGSQTACLQEAVLSRMDFGQPTGEAPCDRYEPKVVQLQRHVVALFDREPFPLDEGGHIQVMARMLLYGLL
ncbi:MULTISPECIES: hypothetical protein [unclassified Streptomyces]|uniref:hypothetical protein n=1 Tax=unclassified Streptomyces TaxID=2593676 RepID=UPI003420909C